ncbi:LysR family transcriptional regulator, partial [Nocardia gipuzkoensis]
MTFSDASLTALRVFREVAERGTLTAAAAALGYTQSAVSRQIAALERSAGAPLLQRRHDGVRLTPAGRIVARRAAAVIDQIDATARELAGLPDDRATVRLGWFASAGAGLIPAALQRLRGTHPGITVLGREAGTPALVRSLRAGTVDLALVASAPPYRPLDAETPA